MTTAPEEWTEAKCLQLIREYKARTVLWDPKDPFYYKKAAKLGEWIEIGEAMGLPAGKCKHKMGVLMSSFRREKAKIMHSLREKDDVLYMSTWFAFKEMSFMMDKANEKQRQEALEDDNETDSSSTKDFSSKRYLEYFNSTLNKKRRTSTKSNSDDEQQDFSGTPTIQFVPQPQPTVSKIERDEEIHSFTSFIASKMKKYSESTKNAVQQAICDIIFKADQNYYDTTAFGNFRIIDDPLDSSRMAVQSPNVIKEEYSDHSA